MWFWISQFILRNRILIISIIGLLTIMFGYYAFTGLRMDNKYGNTLPKNSPAQDDYLRFIEMFGENTGVLVIAVESDSLYTEDNFLKWKEIGDSIAGLEGINTVVSEANLISIVNNTQQNKFDIEPVFEDETFTEKSIQEIKEQVRKVPLYDGLLYNDSTGVSLMLVSIAKEYLDDIKKSEVVFQAEQIAKSHEASLGEMHFSGLPHIRVVMGKRLVDEMYIFIGLAIFVTSLLLYLFFRSIRVVLYCDLVVFTAVIWSLGSIAMMGFKLSILMALIPPLIIVIGIPDCVYLLMKFHQEVKFHGKKIKALSRVIHRVGNATFLTNLTTAMGFCTFIFVNSEKLAEFGIASSINILMVFLLSICIIPILFSFNKTPKKKHIKHLDRNFTKSITRRLINLTANHRRAIYGITLLAVILAVIGATKIETTGNLTSDLPDSDPILKDIEFLQENFGGAIPFEIMVNYKEDARKFDRQFLTKIETVQANLAKDSVLTKSLSIVNFMKLINMAYYGNNPSMYKLINRRDMLRLQAYVKSFEEETIRKKEISNYQDSLRLGNQNYEDSLLYISPKIAKAVLNYVPKADTLDSTIASPYPSKHQIANYLKTSNSHDKTLKVAHDLFPPSNAGVSLSELIDTANTTLRIRMQIKDLESFEISNKINDVSGMIDTVLNPNYSIAMGYLKKFKAGNTTYADSIFSLSSAYRNNTTALLADGNDSIQFQFDLHPELLASYYDKNNFNELLDKAIQKEKLEYTITGVSVVVAEGTQYLIKNLLTSIIFAIVTISFLMALLFGTWRMVVISMIPNLIPLIITAGVMGVVGIPLKPSTLLVFSISFGICVDNTIQFLSRYRRQMKLRPYDQRGCILYALNETGITMYYTAVVLICGFSMFVFSQFGGTKALGLLISLTILIALFTNSLVVPSLLLSLEKSIAKKAFKEPLINVYYADLDVDIDELEIDPETKRIYSPDEKLDE